MAIQFDESKQVKKLAQLRKREAEEVTRVLSGRFDIPYLDLASVPISTDALKLIPEERARAADMGVIQSVGRKLQIVVVNPEKTETARELDALKTGGYDPQLFLVSKNSLEKVWRAYKEIPETNTGVTGFINVAESRMQALREEISSLEILKERIEALKTAKISELLELIIAGALATDASDVHMEPQAEEVRIRYRIDGILADIAALPLATYKFMLGRVKLVSELTLNVKDKAQDGRFTIKAPEGEIEVRVSTLPGPYGENIVMRILNPKAINLSLSDLGLQPWMEAAVEAELKKPNGMVITTGPTGSGKTTTLYAFIKKVHEPGIKIITLEDPIEYHLEGIEQTQVEPQKGYDFAEGLRAILRQDPDVILVGEIRDTKTAETAMHASLTGHLVFSTLHTNNAAGTIPRLLDMEVKTNIIAPAINMAMAQRLVRRLCAACKTAAPATAEEKAYLEKEITAFPAGIEKPSLEHMSLARRAGCKTCHGSGYKGRIGVYEIVLIDDAIERLILKEPSEADIKEAAIKQGQITMKQDGILKVIAGLTDIPELERVVG